MSAQWGLMPAGRRESTQSCSSQVDMLHRPAVLDYLAEHLRNLGAVMGRVRVVSFVNLHDIVPSETELTEASILLQNLEDRSHLHWHQVVPANVEGDERLLGLYHLAEVH